MPLDRSLKTKTMRFAERSSGSTKRFSRPSRTSAASIAHNEIGASDFYQRDVVLQLEVGKADSAFQAIMRTLPAL
jgi:hypothetical protein